MISIYTYRYHVDRYACTLRHAHMNVRVSHAYTFTQGVKLEAYSYRRASVSSVGATQREREEKTDRQTHTHRQVS
jgi:hypothetical protein